MNLSPACLSPGVSAIGVEGRAVHPFDPDCGCSACEVRDQALADEEAFERLEDERLTSARFILSRAVRRRRDAPTRLNPTVGDSP